jgi:hypothetical protein
MRDRTVPISLQSAAARLPGIPQGQTLRFGALAQLGERLICIQEVTGSIPVGSTRSRSRHDRRHQDRVGSSGG